eukprot:UN2446
MSSHPHRNGRGHAGRPDRGRLGRHPDEGENCSVPHPSCTTVRRQCEDWHLQVDGHPNPSNTSSSYTVAWLLERQLVPCKRGPQLHVQGEGNVNQSQRNDDAFAHQLGLREVALGHEDRTDLLPTDAAMVHEDTRGKHIEYGPDRVPEDLELKCVDVADAGLGDVRVLCPEKIQRQKALEVDHERGWANVVGAKLLRVAKAELEQVDCHERHQHQTGDGEVQDSHARALHQFE